MNFLFGEETPQGLPTTQGFPTFPARHSIGSLYQPHQPVPVTYANVKTVKDFPLSIINIAFKAVHETV